MSIALHLEEVRAGLRHACEASGRDPAGVTLIAVSKTFPERDIREAYAAGQRHFGENRAQDLRDKAQALADLPDLVWHFIGRIQTNKAKYIAPVSARIHGVEDVHQAEALARRAPGPLRCLISVNTGAEDSKSGVAPAEVLETAAAVDAVPGIEVVGLMTLPPWFDDPEQVAPYFAQLAAIAEAGRARGLPLHELSMGMSHDYPVAIRHGATWVRVGTAIFGSRS